MTIQAATELLTKDGIIVPGRIMKLEFIPEKYNATFTRMDPNHIGKSVYEGCKVTWGLPVGQSGYKRILNAEQQEAFETIFQLEKGMMSFYNFGKPNNFWKKGGVVSVERDGLEFDLEDPTQALKVLVLQVQSNIAPTWEQRNDRKEYKWALKDKFQQIRVNADFAKLKSKAWIEIEKMDMNRKINVLLSLGIKLPTNPDEAIVLTNFEAIVENKQTKAQLPSVKDLLEAIKDTDIDIKAFVEEALKYKIYEYSAPGKYKHEGEFVVNSGGKQGLIEWLKKPETQVHLYAMKERLKSLKQD